MMKGNIGVIRKILTGLGRYLSKEQPLAPSEEPHYGQVLSSNHFVIIQRIENKFLRASLLIFFLALIIQAIVIIFQGKKIYQATHNQRLILTPAVSKTVIVEAKSNLDESFVKSAATSLVYSLESWSWEDARRKYESIAYDTFEEKFAQKYYVNLAASNFFDIIESSKLISIFRPLYDKCLFGWNSKQYTAISLVAGIRKTFTQEEFRKYNRQIQEKEVAYVVFSKAHMPDARNNLFLAHTNMIVFDSGPNPYDEAVKAYNLAMREDKPAAY